MFNPGDYSCWGTDQAPLSATLENAAWRRVAQVRFCRLRLCKELSYNFLLYHNWLLGHWRPTQYEGSQKGDTWGSGKSGLPFMRAGYAKVKHDYTYCSSNILYVYFFMNSRTLGRHYQETKGHPRSWVVLATFTVPLILLEGRNSDNRIKIDIIKQIEGGGLR